MDQKTPEWNFRKLGYAWRSHGPVLRSRKFWQILFLSPLEMSRDSNKKFWSNGKHPATSGWQTTTRPRRLRRYLCHSCHPIIVSSPIMTSLHISSTPLTKDTWRLYTTPFTRRHTPSNGRSNQAISRMTTERHRFTSPVTWAKFLSVTWSTRITTIH